MKDGFGIYTGEWHGSDASGAIAIRYPDGGLSYCRVGYVTRGMTAVPRFAIRARQCNQVEA